MRLAAAFLLAALLAACVAAQSAQTTGTIQGSVLDSSGASIARVRVTAVHQETGAARVTETGASGLFRFAGLAIGTYALRLEKEGFATVAVEPFPLSLGQVVGHRIEMTPAAVIEKLEVKEQPEALEAAATAASVALGYKRIEESPASNRNYLNFVLMAPGVAVSSGSNAQRAAAGVRSPAADSGFTFGGLRGRNNSLLIDGVDNRDETTGGNRVAIGLEMVQEFRVTGTVVGAEFGGAAGGLVNVVTRSGANLRHGDWTFFTQNERLNARNPEAITPARPRFRRYQPGVSTSGPLRRDRTFFSTAIEHEFEASEEWSDAPEGALADLNRALMRPEFSAAAVRRVERGLFPAGSRETEFSFKANHQAGLRHSLSARHAFSRGRITNEVLGADNFSDRSARGSSLTTDHSFVAGWIAVPSPHVVNDLRVQTARRSVAITPNSRGAMLEIPGVLTLGQAYRLDASRLEDHYEMVESLNLSAGRHQLALGGSLHPIRLNASIANRFSGVFIFPTLADFLRAEPDVFIQAFGDPATRFSTLPLGVWFQDRWQPLPGLTVEAGLRYDRQRMPAGFAGSGRNLAPRLGLAWRPGGTAGFVLRAGAGLFYDRYPLAFLNDAIQKDGRRGFEQYLVGDAAARVFRPWPASFYRPDRRLPATYSRKLTAGVERSLGKNTTLTVEYSAVRGLRLPRIRNISGTLPALWQLEQTARSDYHGASVSLNRRMSRELTFLVAYNIGRTWDDASDFDEQPADPWRLGQDRARSRQHQAHRLAASALWELPDEALAAAPAWLRRAFERITFSPIVTAGSGRPINALDSTDTFRTGAYPISARPFGLPRNPYFSPATFSMDLRVMKTFLVKGGRMWLQPGLEAFNLTNHTNALRVSPYYAARGAPLSSYRGMVETLNARQVQFFVQWEY